MAEAGGELERDAVGARGGNGWRIGDGVHAEGGEYRLESVATLADAVAAARAATQTGGVVLLSPGAPSFDQFKDYAELSDYMKGIERNASRQWRETGRAREE